MAATNLITTAEFDPALWPKWSTLNSTLQLQLIAGASRCIERECDRILGQATQYEIYRPGRSDTFKLNQWPVQSVTSVRAGLFTPISITNTSTAVQRATVAFTTTGEPLELSVTGISLTSIASGVVTTTPFLFATYPTLNSLAAAINAVSGWTAIVAPGGDVSTGGWGLYPTTDLLADMGAQQAKFSGTATIDTGAQLKMYGRDMRYGLDINGDSRKGRISLFESMPDGYRFPDRQFTGYGYGDGGGWGNFGGDGLTGGPFGQSVADPRIGGVQVNYTAGYAEPDVPVDLKIACIHAVKYLFESIKQSGPAVSETIGDYSYSLGTLPIGFSLPANVVAICDRHRRNEIIIGQD